MAPGCHVGYRRLSTGGTWIGRWRNPEDGQRRYEALGAADDHVDADGRRILGFAQAQTKARNFFKRMEREAAGDFQPGDAPFTVAVALENYFKDREERGHKSVDGDRTKAGTLIVPQLGSVVVAKLTKGKLEQWLKELAATPPRVRSSAKAKEPRFRAITDPRARMATANRTLAVLKAALNKAHVDGRVPHDDAWRLIRPFRAAAAARVRILTDDEARRFLNACRGDFRQLATAAILTGCRYSELGRLVAEDFKADVGRLHIRISKSGHERHVVLTREAQAYFAQLTRGRSGDDLILRREGGKPWDRSHQVAPMREACEAAMIKPLGFHQLRHLHASRLIMGGAHPVVVAQQLGHRSIAMVERHYGHLIEGHVSGTIRNAFAPLGVVDADNIVDLKQKV
jgi:integrase